MTSNKMIDSPAARISALADSFKDVLKRGQQYVKLLDQLAQTGQAKDLLTAATTLTTMDLQNAFIEFPQHYQAADYYMLFMGRLLEMHQVGNIQIGENSQHQFVAAIDPLDDAEFKFEVNDDGEAAFTEQHQAQPLFYLNFTKRLFCFNNRALVNYFIVYALKKHSDLELRDAIKPLIEFANELADDLNFTINLGILNTANSERFKLQDPDLQLTVIDRLFVRTAETDYMLMNLPQNSGAELLLDRGIKLDLSFDPDDYHQEWAFQVKDPGEQVSFFDLLLHYNLIRQWYLNDRMALAVRSAKMAITKGQDSTKIADTDKEMDKSTTESSVPAKSAASESTTINDGEAMTVKKEE